MHDPSLNSTAILSFLNLLYIKGSLVCYKYNVLKIMQLINKNSLILFVLFTNSNIICTLTNLNGQVLKSISAGSKKVRGVKKITNMTIFNIIKVLYKHVLFCKSPFLYLRVKGSNKNKAEFFKFLKVKGFNILIVQEKLLLPHGGCKNPSLRKL